MSSSDYGEEPERPAAGGGGFLTHIPAILWQRRWFIIIPFILALVGAGLVAIFAPPVYRSSARILVQSPQLSGAILGDQGPEIIDRRIARIREQAMSRPDLVALIEKYALYKDMRAGKPLSEVIEKMRDAVVLAPAASDTGAGDDRTISIQLSFDYFEAGPAQTVTQELLQRILELDASGNSVQAANRVQFLTEQARGLDKQIKDIQGQIADINLRNGQVLSDGGMMMMGGNTGSYDVQIAALQRDNASLISQRNASRTSDQRDPVVSEAERALAQARATYTESHPDVVLAKQRLAEAKELAKSNTAKLPTQSLDDQIAFNNNQINMLRGARDREMGQVSSAMSARSRAPLIQQQISQLQQQLTQLNTQYDGVSTKLMAARAGVKAEDEQMGERLTVVDPPVVPDKPMWPNRPLIAALGVVGGLGAGIVLAFIVELLLRPIRDPAALTNIVGLPPLAVIPPIRMRIANADKKASIWTRIWPISLWTRRNQ